ncbi:Inositol 2-dehydrogenase [Pontiella desulfatans]|uniref:Inositol 2-dehydrogenase n=1 Tax=Pontiella desulfatans TaxID=2750659 RepID=A0A6C2TY50_PONDE|nr:Gfo/Idh/MocA family oxidoreductase [Pontiella desulfatans]VGO12374.1 Inositol 2-dehydrogenase [Pontiella desulfatans]
MTNQICRRKVLAASAAVAAFNIVPSSVLAQSARKDGKSRNNQLPPSERLNLGFVGIGGKGRINIQGCAAHNIHSLCDVDQVRSAPSFKKHPPAKRFEDWRVMLDKEAKNLDAVVITTPDHTHAVVAMAAMQLGLPIYCEKPLTRTISEARILTEYARENKIVCQMGNQGHAREGARLVNEWIKGGLLGDVAEVHCWSDRPIWPQGIVRPKAQPAPSTLNWDLWLGPAPDAPFGGTDKDSVVAPFNWRAYYDYGAGALGDMGAHIMDYPVWALGLGAPLSVEAEFERTNPASAKHTYPSSATVTFQFAARGARPPVTLKWFDGKTLPPRPEALEKERTLTSSGMIFHGSKNSMMCTHKTTPRLFPESAMQAVARAGEIPPKTMQRSPGHYVEWFNAIKANDPSIAKSNFDYAGPLTETILLGCVAERVGAGTKLMWDSKNMKTDHELANRLIQHEYREGWTL